jgi:H+/Cl- antiporter ClcA
MHAPSDFNYLVYFMMGIIGGAIASMVFVTYLIKIGKFAKKLKGKPAMRGSPGSAKSTGIEGDEFSADKFV